MITTAQQDSRQTYEIDFPRQKDISDKIPKSKGQTYMKKDITCIDNNNTYVDIQVLQMT